jgi:hypothetical protein
MGAERGSPRWFAEFTTLAALLLITRVGDGLLTHAVTPDLSREANPVASVFGFGWAGLIAAAALVLGGVMWLNYVSLTWPCDNFPAAAGEDWPAFRAEYFNVRGTALFARRPGRVFAYVCGYAFPRAIIAWSVLLMGHNRLAYTDAEWYRPIRAYRLSFAIYLALPLLCFLLVHRLQRRDHRRYLKSHTAGPATVFAVKS